MDNRSLLPIGTKLQMGKYRVDRYLSSGSFGNTYVITNLQFGEQYAMKEFFMKGVNERGNDYTTICVSNKVNYERYEQQREKFKKEARRMRQLSNKHLVKVYDLFDENGTTYYVMDLIHGQTMQDAMEETGRTYTESQAINVIYQILEALDTLHQKGIWHLDLKPANIMIDNLGFVKVIDFGASKQMNANFEYTSTSAAICYTPGYAPTEQVDQNISRIGPWTDLYALGATLYYMLTGSQPPSSSEILDGYAFQFNAAISIEMQKLIIWMMMPNRKERPQSVAEVYQYLKKMQKGASCNLCPQCGASVDNKSAFCSNCGTSLKNVQGPNPQPGPQAPVNLYQPTYQKKSGFSPLFIIIPIIGVVILGVLAVGGWLLYGKYIQDSPDQDITLATLDYDTNGYSYTDLGLSVMWADYNVGASSPKESGNLYGWGNTNLNLSTDLYRYPKSDPPYNISGTEYDVAKQLWGGDWRMPTLSELRELQDRCRWEVVEYAVGTFCRVTGPNDNSILLPLDGYKKGSEIKSVGEWGFIWSSVLYVGNNQMAANLSFSRKGHVETSGYFRYGGESIRPVMDKK